MWKGVKYATSIYVMYLKTIDTFVYAHPVMHCLFRAHAKLVNKQYGCL